MDGLIDSFNPSRPDILHAISSEQGDIALLQPLYAKRIEPGHLPVQRTFFRDSTPSAGADKDGVAALDAHSGFLFRASKSSGYTASSSSKYGTPLSARDVDQHAPRRSHPYLDRASRHSSLRPRN